MPQNIENQHSPSSISTFVALAPVIYSLLSLREPCCLLVCDKEKIWYSAYGKQFDL